MFKSTDKIPTGEFSKIVARHGGQDNAFTGHDVTAYFQRIAKERLPTVMEMEADRMANLRLTEEDVVTERKVILEERRSRIENNPGSILHEQMMAALYPTIPTASRSSAGSMRWRSARRTTRCASTSASMRPTTPSCRRRRREPDEVKLLAEEHLRQAAGQLRAERTRAPAGARSITRRSA